jgi:hypothetical protein
MGAGDAPAGDDRPAGDERSDGAGSRQRVVRSRGGRRARLTPAPGTDPAPEAATPGAHDDVERSAARPATPDDERITRERPPHW